ncbi:MAG: hypothetical protein Q8M88_03555 [Phenylobacterium sp.]|uniref:hypothetical protein n=1 Tax=Phenylobacterium sp. TaxID=1871053 RepID=UPI002734CAC7|nr:hypothetical protein [Phenylobacterium sp.]MDP3173493.1 hypothetical protein [Phenylobacterium sp.]
MIHDTRATGRRSAPTAGEKLLLFAIRGWAAMRQAGERPHDQLAAAIAQRASSRTAALFIAWIQAVESASRRPIRIQCACCGGMSNDEQRLVLATGVAPIAMDMGERLLEPITLDAREVMVLGRALGASLAAAGLPLPARLTDEVDDDKGTVHADHTWNGPAPVRATLH